MLDLCFIIFLLSLLLTSLFINKIYIYLFIYFARAWLVCQTNLKLRLKLSLFISKQTLMFFLLNHQDVFEPLCSFIALIRKLTYMGSRAKDKNGEDFTITQKKRIRK